MDPGMTCFHFVLRVLCLSSSFCPPVSRLWAMRAELSVAQLESHNLSSTPGSITCQGCDRGQAPGRCELQLVCEG